jgi:hypothetical protein
MIIDLSVPVQPAISTKKKWWADSLNRKTLEQLIHLIIRHLLAELGEDVA